MVLENVVFSFLTIPEIGQIWESVEKKKIKMRKLLLLNKHVDKWNYLAQLIKCFSKKTKVNVNELLNKSLLFFK